MRLDNVENDKKEGPELLDSIHQMMEKNHIRHESIN